MSDTPDTVVLIHGLWMTPRSWEKWAERYEGRGYKVLAPAWPGLEAEVEALNDDPSPLETLDVEQIVDNYESIIRGLDSAPIIVGHRSAARSRSSCSTAVSAPPALVSPRER